MDYIHIDKSVKTVHTTTHVNIRYVNAELSLALCMTGPP